MVQNTRFKSRKKARIIEARSKSKKRSSKKTVEEYVKAYRQEWIAPYRSLCEN